MHPPKPPFKASKETNKQNESFRESGLQRHHRAIASLKSHSIDRHRSNSEPCLLCSCTTPQNGKVLDLGRDLQLMTCICMVLLNMGTTISIHQLLSQGSTTSKQRTVEAFDVYVTSFPSFCIMYCIFNYRVCCQVSYENIVRTSDRAHSCVT